VAGEQAPGGSRSAAPDRGAPDEEVPERGQAVYRLVEIGKAEGQGPGTVVSNAFEPEDEFARHYLGMEKDAGLIQPPYNLKMLDRLCQENNALGPCIEAMVTNIDGTGHVFEAEGEEQEDARDDHKIEELEDFFAEVWPGESFQTLRRRLRRDQERTGNAYLEVVRNPAGEIVFLRHVDTKMIRLVKLDEPVAVEKTVIRRGKPVTIAVAMRERRFAQMIGHKLVYFKEFGARRDLDKLTGKWATGGQQLPAGRRGSELIHLTKYPDAHTPYGVPCWIAQTPSVLGSRKAEEFNLEFFENGGVPPILILIQGGLMADKTRKAIEQRLHGPAKKANRVQVIEADPTGGSLDHPGNTRITVERFGAERVADSMFEGYDERCEVRVRRSFRLPPIFVGQSQDYSFATAFVSYTVTEAQVFKPEREEFDEIMTIKLLPAMGYSGYRLRSLPLTIEGIDNKLKGLEIANATNRVDPADVVHAVNEVTGLKLKVTDKPVVPLGLPGGGAGGMGSNGMPPGSRRPAATKAEPDTEPDEAAPTAEGILALASDTVLAMRQRDMAGLQKNLALSLDLAAPDQRAYRQALATWQFVDPSLDIDGLGELAGCVCAVMHANAPGP
jgi:PBSX family phage portal protein